MARLGQRADIRVVSGVIGDAEHDAIHRIAIFAQELPEVARETSKWAVESQIGPFGPG